MQKLYKIIILVVLVSFSCFLNAKNSGTVYNLVLPSATITTSSPSVCQGGASPIITFTGSGGTAPYTFTYKIGTGTDIDIVSIGNIATVNVPTTASGVFVYTLVSVKDSSGTQVQSGSATVTVNPQPDASLGGTGSGTTFNGIPAFRICSNVTSSFAFSNASSTSSTLNTNYTIDWGDGSPNFTSASWTTTTHTYAVGYWNLTYTIQSTNGCEIIKKYVVFVGSNPAVSLGNPGNTDICNSTQLTFPISGTENNPPGTTYTVSFNDGSSSITYNHPPPSTISHTFLITSCGVTSSDGTNSYPNSFRANIVAQNPCGTSAVGVVPIYVSTPPVPNFTIPSNGCTNTSICLNNTTTGGFTNNGNSNSCNTNPKFVWTISPSTGYSVVSGSIGNDFGSTDPNLWLSGSSPLCLNFSQAGTYTITIKTANRCGAVMTKTQQICIEPPLTPSFTLNNNSGCTPLAVTATNTTVTTNTCTTTTYVWNATHVPAYCGASIAAIPNQTTPNALYNFTEPGTYTIRLTATNSCGSVNTSQIVEIKKPPTVSINPVTSICQTLPNTSISPTAIATNCGTQALTYAWSFPGGTPATSTAAVPGVISYTATGTFTISLSVTNECGTMTATNRIFTISPSPTITGTLFSCVGFTSQLTGSATAATTSPWTSSNPSVATVSSTGLVTGVSGGTTTITYTNANNCKITEVFTVNPAPTITPLISSTVCIGGTPNVLSFTISGATGTPTYQWYSNAVNNTTSGTAIPGEINTTYNPSSMTAGTVYYYCIITLPSGGCSNIKTNTATVTILPNAIITTQPTPTQNLCVGVTIPNPLTASYSGGTGISTYQWYSNTTNTTTGGSPIAGATAANYTPPTFTSPGSYYYYVTVSLSGNSCLPVTSNTAEIIVFADPTISSQPTALQTLCQNATPSSLDVAATGGNGTFSYQWYSNSLNSNTGGILIPAAISSSYVPPTTTIGTKYYYAIVSQNSTPGCGINSATAAIVVISSPTITQPASSTVCIGGTPAVLSITVSGATGTPLYQWYSNSIDSTSGGTTISGATGATFGPPNSALGTVYYYCIVTLPSGGCSNIISNTAAVTINAGATIDLQPTPTQSLCVGATISTPLNVTYLGGTGTPSYQWYLSTTSTNLGGTIISGATNASYTPSVFTTAGTYYYYAEVTLSGSGCGSIKSNAAEIVIVADPVISAQPLTSQSVCQNVVPTSLSVAVSGGISAGYLYQWFSNTSNNNTSGTPILGATTDSYNPSTSNVGTVYYYCVITQTIGSGCNVSSTTAAVMVNLAPAITTQPQSSSICIGQTPTLLSVSYINGVGTPTYQWYSNSVNSSVGSNLIVGATNSNYSPPNATVGTLYYYCIITLPSSGGCSDLTSAIASVTINPNPVIANKTALICSGNPFTILPLNSGSEIVPVGTTYTWTNPTIFPAGSITGASAQSTPQSNISQNLINTTISPAIVTYTVTPLSGFCIGTNFTIAVTVNPAISPNVTATNSTCFGSNSGSLQTNITGGIPFSSGAPYQISWTGPNGFTSAAASISNLAPGNYNLLISDAGGCPVNETYLITEPDDIILTTALEKDVTCFNDANGAIDIIISGGTLNYKINWTKNGIAYANTEDLSNLSPGIYAVTVSDANNCGPKTATFTITEPPVLAVNLVNKTNILCFGDATGVITVNAVGGTFPYTYAWSGPNNFTSTNQNLTAVFAGTYTLIVSDIAGCTKNLIVQLTQTPEIKITATTTPIICYGGNDASITLTINGGVTPYNIAWSNLGGGTFQNNLSAGDYIITVTDALNCIQTLNVNIPEAPIFTINPVVKNISCFGDKNGSINLNLVGGIAPIKLVWDDNPVAGTTRNNLGPGSYTVTIVDGKPCTIKRTFIILEPQLLVLSANLTDALDCNNANTGAINLLVSGGSAPFAYAWSNGATTEDLANIPAGNYLVTVKDANGCTKQAQYSINRPPPIVTAVVTKTDFDCQTKFVKQTFVASVSGGVPPYQLVWSSGTVSGPNNEFMNTSQNGTVILNVTDAIGCKSNYSFNVNTPTLGSPSFETSSFAFSTFGIYSINDPIQFTNNATGDYISMIWDFGYGSFSSELNPVHTFINPKEYVVTQTVTYPFGCVYVQKITLIIGKGYVLVVPTAFTPNDDTLNDSFRPVTKGLKNIRLDIYDTWGSMIYSESGEVLRGRDGKIKSSNAENGNYYCKVSGETFYGTVVNANHPFVLIK